MVEVLVHEYGPLLWLEPTKEGMRMLGAGASPFCGETIDSSDEPGAFLFEITGCGVLREEFTRGR